MYGKEMQLVVTIPCAHVIIEHHRCHQRHPYKLRIQNDTCIKAAFRLMNAAWWFSVKSNFASWCTRGVIGFAI